MRQARAGTYVFFFTAFACIVFLSHSPFVGLPLFWDELGYFVPAALDLYRDGALIPHSATPIVHPPGLVAWLATVWTLTGYSILATRLAMLLLASTAALVAFLLAIRLSEKAAGAPAFLAVLLLLASPLFYTQAMMAQLDMPSMLLTTLALLLFLRGKWPAAVAASAALVMVKETGVVVPLILGFWTWRESGWRRALWFLLPCLPLCAWLLLLARSTGHLFGDRAFTEYNLFYPMHPVRVAFALLRRFYTLFFENFQWAGTLAIWFALRRTTLFRSRAWKVAVSVGAPHVLVVSLLSGATLERYLMPVLPILYAATAMACSGLPKGWRGSAQTVLLAGLLAGHFWNPPYHFPHENNLAMIDFVHLHQSAAEVLEHEFAGRTIVTAWPLAAALRRPEYGYVHRPLPVVELPDFAASTVGSLKPAGTGIFVLYSREWEPEHGLLLYLPPLAALRRRFLSWEPPVSGEWLQSHLGLVPVAEWRRRGQWIRIYAAPRRPT